MINFCPDASGLILPVLRSGAACAPWLAAAAGADAAGHTGPVAEGMKSGSRQDDAAGEKEGLFLRTQEATDLTVPERLQRKTGRILYVFKNRI